MASKLKALTCFAVVKQVRAFEFRKVGMRKQDDVVRIFHNAVTTLTATVRAYLEVALEEDGSRKTDVEVGFG